MGALQAREMSQREDIDTALLWHLRHNHYPPIPASMLEACKTAVKLAREGVTQARVQLPSGVTWRGNREAPVWAIVEQHHLGAFVETGEEENHGA